MENSWLIQRLERPMRGSGKLAEIFKDNPFSFGGGIKNGGLSDEAMGLLRDIFQFDYMGAAEYEWGAVPEALQMIAKADELTTATITVLRAEVPEPWRSSKDKKAATPEGEATIYILAQTAHMDEVKKRVAGWARGKGPDTRDGIMLTYALRPNDEWDERRCGWLELDNGFMFFTAEDMWAATCDLFGVKGKV